MPRKALKILAAATVVASLAVIFSLLLAGSPRRASAASPTGVFVVRCDPSHVAKVDPIVAPGMVSAHQHQFFGNTSTNSDSTLASMEAAGTTCRDRQDTAGYWVPTLCHASAPTPDLLCPTGTIAAPRFSFAYYRNNAGPAPRPFPQGLKIVAAGLLDPSRTFWDCFDTGGHFSAPPACSGATNWLQLHLAFPSCWDGQNLDSPDHRSHMAYPASGGNCPSGHSVKVPFINFFIQYQPDACAGGCVLSDGTTVMHADFWNTWQPGAQEALVQRCIIAGVNCGQVSG